jgi:hypothetical protein
MAVNEISVGPLYLAVVPLNRFACPVHKAGVVEIRSPWRRGRAVVFPFLPFRALVVGAWRRTLEEDIAEDFEDDRWFNPKWLDDIPVSQIAGWEGRANAE